MTTLIGTIAETILTMYLFGSLWHKWTIAFKVVTPMLHVLFSTAQLWGSWIFWKMYRRQTSIVRAYEEGKMGVEAGLSLRIGVKKPLGEKIEPVDEGRLEAGNDPVRVLSPGVDDQVQTTWAVAVASE